MATYPLVYVPDPRLRKVTEPVDTFNSALQTLIDDMFATMYLEHGVGLAAPQIGINQQLAVIDASGDKSEPLVLINPSVIERRGETVFQEGCLSVPGAFEKVTRSEWVKVKALDRDGNPFEVESDGLLGEALQHEIDHLNGKLFIDLLSPVRRDRARKKCEKYLRAKNK